MHSTPEPLSEERKPILDPQGYPFIVTCKFCNGSGSVPDVSQWPPQSVCPGCKGAGVHVLR